MEDQDELGESGDIWEYICDIVVQGDWEDRDDDLHLGRLNEGFDMGGRTWDCVRDMSVQIRCPHNSGVGVE